MQKIMLDTNEYDRLLAAQDAYDMLLGLLFRGRIELLSTHIQRDEITRPGLVGTVDQRVM